MLLTVTIIVLTLLLAGVFIERYMVHKTRNNLASYARDIAYAVAEIPKIQQFLDWPDGELIVQPIVENIMKKVEVKYILAIGGEVEPVIEGTPYSSYPEVTTSGPTLRAFVPVYRNEKQVGAIAVYLWTSDINNLIWDLRKKIISAIVISLFVGIFCAHFLSKNIKSSMFGLEPYQLSSLLKEREALLESIKEGIVAVDNEGSILYLNKQARKILGINDNVNVRNKDVRLYVPNSRLNEVISSGRAQYDQEQDIGKMKIITNRIPIKVDGNVYGAIASFRSIAEMQSLAEELTGAKKLAKILKVQNEALRVQKHEFLNQLHTISGLLQIEDYTGAVEFMNNASSIQQNMIRFVMGKIQNSSVAGLILGKIGRCKELGIECILSKHSSLSDKIQVDINSILLCLGNLIENSMEAVLMNQKEQKRIVINISEKEKYLTLSIKDNGLGITLDQEKRIFQKGFTTKNVGKRGYGLFLVKSTIDSLRGKIEIKSEIREGTLITISIPKWEGEKFE